MQRKFDCVLFCAYNEWYDNISYFVRFTIFRSVVTLRFVFNVHCCTVFNHG